MSFVFFLQIGLDGSNFKKFVFPPNGVVFRKNSISIQVKKHVIYLIFRIYHKYLILYYSFHYFIIYLLLNYEQC